MGRNIAREDLFSWGRYPRPTQTAVSLSWRDEPWPVDGGVLLPRGSGRSYGDVCLNSRGALLLTRSLNRFIAWDGEQGILRCEAGTTLDQILSFAVPRGWFPPVVPGTQYVSVGGAIANDIHGKNHHLSGTFGRHVLRFELRRSDGSRHLCSPIENPALFGATIGGLGLTGMITWAEIQLTPIETPWIKMESVKFRGLEEFFALSRGTSAELPYTVAWLDCVATGVDFCRGIFMRGAHVPRAEMVGAPGMPRRRRAAVPLDAPGWLLNRWSVKAFNSAYFNRQRSERHASLVGYESFFFPLDGVWGWNRIYGRRGFFQFQCVVPSAARQVLQDILMTVVESGRASFLAVLKEFGAIPSPGWLSFPRPGVTLCLDFPNDGEGTVALMKQLEVMVVDAGGALYPAKDALMSGETFRASFPRWKDFLTMVDPGISSDLWQRVQGVGGHE